jgi:hypothetical protein
MAEVEIESVQNETVEESDADEIVEDKNTTIEEVIVPKTKKSGKISKKQQRLNAIEDFKNGKTNDEFKVFQLKNGSYRVVKRENEPVKIESNNDAKNELKPVINQQYTNDQFLINHILELEKKFEKLRLKQKKLKKSHKKMKADIYDDDIEPIDLNTVSANLESLHANSSNLPHEVDVKNEEVVNEKIVERPAVEPTVIRYNKAKRMSWRQMLSNQ